MIKLIITIVTFLVVDFAWITLFVNSLYKKNLPKDFLADPPRLIYAVVFYLLFAFTLWFLFIKDADSITVDLIIRAFLFGLTSYATYSLTNMAIIDKWNLSVTIPDLIWGGVLSALVTIITVYLSNLL
jgi:uncharacterized membrane protein